MEISLQKGDGGDQGRRPVCYDVYWMSIQHKRKMQVQWAGRCQNSLSNPHSPWKNRQQGLGCRQAAVVGTAAGIPSLKNCETVWGSCGFLTPQLQNCFPPLSLVVAYSHSTLFCKGGFHCAVPSQSKAKLNSGWLEM